MNLKEAFQFLKTPIKGQDPVEREVRFAKFPAKNYFDLLRKLRTECNVIYSVSETYRDHVRVEKSQIHPPTICRKTILKKQKTEFGNLVISTEKPCPGPTGPVLHKREKTRSRFPVENCYLDLTRVVNSEGPQFEVEIELTNGTTLENFVKLMTLVLEFFPRYIKTPEVYYKLTGGNYFKVAQCETLTNMNAVSEATHAVTEKTDGQRGLLFKGTGAIYLMTTNGTIQTNYKSDSVNFVIDVEVVSKDIHVFDVLVYNDTDLRGNGYMLKDRLKLAHEIARSFNDPKVKTKKFYFENQKREMSKMLKNPDLEGIIFTPKHEPYPKKTSWPSLLKWKPRKYNTIDFYAVKKQTVWELHVNNPRPAERARAPVKSTTFFKPQFQKQTSTVFATTTQNVEDTTFLSNTVIECYWDGKAFAFLRTRWDKTHGNHISVAKSIWGSIQNEITPEQLIGRLPRCTLDINCTESENDSIQFDPRKKFTTKREYSRVVLHSPFPEKYHAQFLQIIHQVNPEEIILKVPGKVTFLGYKESSPGRYEKAVFETVETKQDFSPPDLTFYNFQDFVIALKFSGDLNLKETPEDLAQLSEMVNVSQHKDDGVFVCNGTRYVQPQQNEN